MTIRKPGQALAKPNSVKLSKGTRIVRVHDRNYGATQFNPCVGNPTRFAPIHDTNGTCVPSLYAADTLEAAIYETIFHDVPAKAARKTMRKQSVLARAEAWLEVQRDLNLVSLRQADLKKWKISRAALIASSPKLYSQTKDWAEAIYGQFPNAEGLEWTSNQCDPDTAYLFFGGRVKATDFKVVSSRDGGTDQSFMGDVRRFGQRSGIKLTL